jgi:hypothetical protein
MEQEETGAPRPINTPVDVTHSRQQSAPGRYWGTNWTTEFTKRPASAVSVGDSTTARHFPVDRSFAALSVPQVPIGRPDLPIMP